MPDIEREAELRRRLRIVLMQLGDRRGDPELEKRAEELTQELQKLKLES